MTIHLPENLESSILEVVHRGQFPSIDEAMAEAARLLLQQLKYHRPQDIGDAAPGDEPRADYEPSNQELQLRLFNAGLLNEIKLPITDLTPYRDREAVPIVGEPLSETVIRERR
jgi:Arc/MetJ-type ribon-helix-helix transcriptional regulator